LLFGDKQDLDFGAFAYNNSVGTVQVAIASPCIIT
jgi:hypothetical protein